MLQVETPFLQAGHEEEAKKEKVLTKLYCLVWW